MPKMYDSEFTLFMREWLEKHSEQREVQRTGRAIWLDHLRGDTGARRRFEAARVPVKPYDLSINNL